MPKRPTTGGRFRRDPQTGDVVANTVDSDGPAIFASADPEPQPDPAEDIPAGPKKRK